MKYALLVGLVLATGCVHPKVKFQKSHLLDPTMDPQKTGGFYNGATDSAMTNTPERAQIGGSGSASTTCPTCGG